MMSRPVLSVLLICLCVSISVGQQMEPNSAGGALTSNGVNPIPGMPFDVGPSSTIDIEISGAPNAPYALFVGQLASNSIFIPVLANQYFDLDPSTTVLLGDALAGGGLLPGFLFFLGTSGTSPWSFPVSPVAVGQRLAFQAVVQDTSLPPFNANLTAAVEFKISNTVRLTGSSFGTFVFPSGPYPMYGNLFTSIDVSTSGWIRFGGGSTTVDAFQNLGKFLAGTTGVGTVATPAPIVSVLWTHMDFPGGASEVIIAESSPGITRIEWRNAIDMGNPLFPGQNIGTIVCVIDVTQGSAIITLDFSAMTFPANPLGMPIFPGPICGVSDGGTLPTRQIEHDLVTMGSVNPTFPGIPVTLYQEFGILSIFSEDVDLSGSIVTFLDVSGGAFQIF